MSRPRREDGVRPRARWAAGATPDPGSGAASGAEPAASLLDLLAVLRAGRPDAPRGVEGDAAQDAAYTAVVALFVARLQATLGRCLRGRLPDVDADTMADLVQEAVLHVIEGAASCRATTDDQVRSWACVVAIRAGLAFLRSARSGQRETRGALSPEAAAARTRVWAEWAVQDDGADAGALRVLARLAADAQDALSPGAVALLWDRVIEDASWAEAAAHLGTTAPGAKRRFQRAQAALRRLLWTRVEQLPEPARSALLTRLRALASSRPASVDVRADVRADVPPARARSGRPIHAPGGPTDRRRNRSAADAPAPAGAPSPATPASGGDVP